MDKTLQRSCLVLGICCLVLRLWSNDCFILYVLWTYSCFGSRFWVKWLPISLLSSRMSMQSHCISSKRYPHPFCHWFTSGQSISISIWHWLCLVRGQNNNGHGLCRHSITSATHRATHLQAFQRTKGEISLFFARSIYKIWLAMCGRLPTPFLSSSSFLSSFCVILPSIFLSAPQTLDR